MKHIKGIFFIVIVTGIFIILGITIWQSPARSQTLIDIFGLIISWPVAVIVLTVFVTKKYDKQIGKLIDGIIKLKLPGGTEISVQPPALEGDKVTKAEREREAEIQELKSKFKETATELDKTRKHADSLKAESEDKEAQIEEFRSVVANYETMIKNLQDGIDNLISYLTKTKENADHWKFMFLNEFLVPTAKNVLKWFGAEESSLQKVRFYKLWTDEIQKPEQSIAILHTLRDYGLIEAQESEKAILDIEDYKITNEGRKFIEFLDAQNPLAQAYKLWAKRKEQESL